MNKALHLGVVGATGLVGETFLKLLEERSFPFQSLTLFASDFSNGKTISFKGKEYPLQILNDENLKDLHLIFFSAGDSISETWAPRAVKYGAMVIDNSSFFRLHPEVPLIVPEVNGHLISHSLQPQIIANPNCSTIQLVAVLAPLSKTYGIKQVHVATYQSASGAGRDGLLELKAQLKNILNDEPPKKEIFPEVLAMNCIPQIGGFDEFGFCSEEQKIMNETRKILDIPYLNISAFTVRIPSHISHAEAVWITLKEKISPREIFQTLSQTPGVICKSRSEDYFTPSQTTHLNEVFVSRIHQDPNDPFTWLLWIVSDNLRKGAATNGIQIAEKIFL